MTAIDRQVTVGRCQILIDARAAGLKKTRCTPEKCALQPTKIVTTAEPGAISLESAENLRGTKHGTYRRWSVSLNHTVGGADPTPMMKNVKVFPRDGGRPFTFEMCPDTGCTMTLISKDVVACQGMTVDTRSRKRVRAVNGQKLDNSWTVSFGIEYQGRTIEVEALFSSSIEGEVLLSWQILKKLGVINSSFPNVQVRAAVASANQHPGDVRQEREARVKLTKLIREFVQVFYEDGPLRTMKGDPMKIHIKTVVKIIPLNVCTPRKTPIAYTQAAKIDSDLKLGIIEKVDGVSD